jgi:signal transduction histidine kinase
MKKFTGPNTGTGKGALPTMRLRQTLLVKLLLAFAVPTLALFAVFAYVALEVTRRDLDAELGTRLNSIAAAASTQLRGKYLLELGPGNEEDRSYQGAVQKLRAIESASGVTLVVLDKDFGVRADTVGTAIGSHRFSAEIDRLELQRVFSSGAQVASVTFEGNDGVTYKTGYAPVYASETDSTVVLAIAAQAPANYFHRISELRNNLMLWGIAIASVVLLATLGMTFLITRNLRRLAAAAERMKSGDLAMPVTANSRDELGVLATTMDDMRIALAQRDAQLQAMLAGIAHEVRNPLAGMTLYAGFLQDELPADDERAGHVKKILRELGYLERVVTEFLHYARRPALQLSRFVLAELLAEIVPLVSHEHGPVVVTCDSGLVCNGDRGALRRALLNIVTNAVQARDPDSTIDIVAAAQPTEIWIDVRNRGPVIGPDIAQRLFEPFFTTREKGTGLGLAFVRDIARAHSGDVELTRQDDVTQFRLLIPTR